jgi:hypothetical protein
MIETQLIRSANVGMGQVLIATARLRKTLLIKPRQWCLTALMLAQLMSSESL